MLEVEPWGTLKKKQQQQQQRQEKREKQRKNLGEVASNALECGSSNSTWALVRENRVVDR